MTTATSDEMVELPLQLTAHPLVPSPHLAPVRLPTATYPTATVGDVKLAISAQWDGTPTIEGLVLILGGRVLRDGEVVQALLEAGVVSSGSETTPRPPLHNTIHVIVRPGAWTKPFASYPPASATVTLSFTAPDLPQPATTSPAPRTEASTLPAQSLTPVAPVTPGYNPAYIAHNSDAVYTTSVRSSRATLLLPRSSHSTTTTSPLPAQLIVISDNSYTALHAVYLYYLGKLSSLQRAVLLLNLQKAHYQYSTRVTAKSRFIATGIEASEGEDAIEDVVEVVSLLKACGYWPAVEQKEQAAEKQLAEWDTAEPGVSGKLEIVYINGVAYVAQSAPVDLSPPSLETLRSFNRAKEVKEILTVMMRLLLAFQPKAAALAYGRAVIASAGSSPIVPGVVVAATLAGTPAVAALRPRARTFSIIINLEAAAALVVPLFLLSLPLAFLLWIFGRHASSRKRIILCTLAVAYVIWEGYSLHRRRVGGLVGRVRRAHIGPRRGEAAAAVPAEAVPGAPVADPAEEGGHAPVAQAGDLPDVAVAGGDIGLRRRRPHMDPAAVPAVPVPGAAIVPTPTVRRPPRAPISRLSPRYWINWIAAIGLASEARELGLVARSIAGRAIAPAPPRPLPHPHDRIGLARERRRRAIRNVVVGIVLFVGTLVPEVEKKRRRALEKRERLLEARRASRGRRAALAEVAAEAERRADVPALAVVAGANLAGGAELGRREVASGTSTPGVFEAVEPETMAAELRAAAQAKERSATATSGSSDSAALVSPPLVAVPTLATGQAESSSTAAATPAAVAFPADAPAGRAVVPDAELFADGPAEADQDEASPRMDGEEDGDSSDDERERLAELERREDDEAAGRGPGAGVMDQVAALF